MAGSAGGCIWYINWAEGTKVKLVSGHTREVVGVAMSSDGELLATVCQDGSVAVWNLNSLEQTVAFHTPKKVHHNFQLIKICECFLCEWDTFC